jgi:predicted metal-dependent hydrolase
MQLPLPLSGAAAPTRGSAAAGSTTARVAPSASPEPPLFVRHARARRYVLRVDGDGRVRVTIPRGGSRREAGAFVDRHREWIARERAKRRETVFVPAACPTLRARALEELPRRLQDLASHFRLTVTRISVRNQRTRWGSCSRDGHICLNWRLVLMPDWVRDYVLVHELMHLRRMDHSPAYWRLVAAAHPEFRAARRWLRQHGESLR